MKIVVRRAYTAFIFFICWIVLYALAVSIRCLRSKNTFPEKPRLIFAGKPISGLVGTALALRNQGYTVLTVANDRNFIREEERFDKFLYPKPSGFIGMSTLLFALHHIRLFWHAAWRYDVLHGYFNGAMFGAGPLMKAEYKLWKLAGRKLILMPYGSDAFIYADMPDAPWAHTIQQTYPHTQKEDREIADRLSVFSQKADAVVGCLVHHIHLPKVTANPLLWYPMEDLGDAPLPSLTGRIKIAHAPNHRVIKGTNLLIDAVQTLQIRGYDIELNIVEGQPRSVVIEALKTADVVIDQIHAGYALHALEGMSLGKIVVTGIDLDDPVYAPHKSILETSPLYLTSGVTVLEDLEQIFLERKSWHTRSEAIKLYANKHHSPEAVAELFTGLYASFR